VADTTTTDRPDVVVICLRDPDHANEYAVFADGLRVEILDIDPGRGDLRDPGERDDFRASREADAQRLERAGHPAAAQRLRDLARRVLGAIDAP
jgi:hypothetical protein